MQVCRRRSMIGYLHSLPPASTLLLRSERFINNANAIAKTISTSRDETRVILQSLDNLRTILSTLLTPGLDSGVDSTCKNKLGVGRSGVSVGLAISSSISRYNFKESKEVWCTSASVTATRLLGIVLVLKAVALFEGKPVSPFIFEGVTNL